MQISELPALLQAWIAVGKAVRIDYGPGKPANEIRHIRAWVDDEIIVYRVWRRGWSYQTGRAYAFLLEYDHNHLTPYARNN